MTRDGTLEGRGLTKRFGGVTALESVTIEIAPGRITALLGENGAGKSTLVACLSGARRPDEGAILLSGREVRFRSPYDALRAGIAVVHQEPQMLDEQTVAANIFMGRLAAGRGLRSSARRLEARAAAHLATLGIEDLAPDRPMGTVGGAQRQLVEIARALVEEPSTLFLDEPNASLGDAETDRLFGVVRGLRDRGVGVVLISHRLREVYDLAEHVVVMRDGRKVLDAPIADVPMPAAVRAIVGESRAVTAAADAPRSPATRPDVAAAASTAPILAVEGLTGPGFRDVSFVVRAGEIMGMAGLVGSGRTEIALGVIGGLQTVGGRVRIDGVPVRIGDPSEAVRRGIAFVPEGRRDAIYYGQSVDFNIRSGAWGRVPRGSRRPSGREARRRVRELMRSLSVKAANPEVRASALSGGNQQKLLFARALSTRPRLLILDEPTHGVDVGTKRETHELIRRLADDGIAVWFISSEVEEVADLATRTLVVHDGRIVDELPGGTAPDAILARSFSAPAVPHGA